MSTKGSWTPSDRDAFQASLDDAARRLQLSIEQSHVHQMWTHFAAVLEANQVMNLTRIVDPVQAAIRHYADSLALLRAPWIASGAEMRLMDVGTGAGFPAIPLSIVRPGWHVTAIDGTGKKIRFVSAVAERLGLERFHAAQGRAEDLRAENKGTCDVVCLRAVSPLARGLRQAHHLVKPGGRLVFYKSAGLSVEEREEGRRAARQLHMADHPDVEVELEAPDESLRRILVSYTKS